MNLRQFTFWNRAQTGLMAGTAAVAAANPSCVPTHSANSTGTVVPFPSTLEGDSADHDADPQTFGAAVITVRRFTGLMNAPELLSFFEENYFGLGRHNGAVFKTREALDLGKQALITKFQNTLIDLIERRRSKLDKIQSEILAIEGVSTVMTQQLHLACDQINREINSLQEQFVAANDFRGWVLEALNRYQIGFGKGLKAAIDFELLGS